MVAGEGAVLHGAVPPSPRRSCYGGPDFEIVVPVLRCVLKPILTSAALNGLQAIQTRVNDLCWEFELMRSCPLISRRMTHTVFAILDSCSPSYDHRMPQAYG